MDMDVQKEIEVDPAYIVIKAPVIKRAEGAYVTDEGRRNMMSKAWQHAIKHMGQENDSGKRVIGRAGAVIATLETV